MFYDDGKYDLDNIEHLSELYTQVGNSVLVSFLLTSCLVPPSCGKWKAVVSQRSSCQTSRPFYSGIG